MKRLILEADILKLIKNGVNILPLGKGDIITPLAMDRIKASGITLVSRLQTDSIQADPGSAEPLLKLKKVAVASDHTGFKMKAIISEVMTGKGYQIIDAGTFDETSCDYPDFAFAASMHVKERKADFAILIDASGIPSAMTANKIPGIRAATCYNEFSARSAREHNNANVLVVGAKALGEEAIKSILEVWLSTSYAGGRHQKRLDKITAIEEKFSKN